MSTITHYLWNEILLYRCYASLRTKLREYHISYDALLKYLKEKDAVISGYFVIACLLDSDEYGDLDIFHPRRHEELKENECATFNRVFEREYVIGTYEKNIAGLPKKTISEMVHYVRKLQVTPTKTLDLVETPCDARLFITKHSNFDFLVAWFDADGFHFPFDLSQWVFGGCKARLLKVGNLEFESYYDPWGFEEEETSCTSDSGIEINSPPFFKWTDQCRNLAKLAAETKMTTPYRNYLPRTPLKNKNLYDLCAVFMYCLRLRYKGKEKVTDFRLLKTFSRTLKYTTRKITITNISDFFDSKILLPHWIH